MRKAEPMAFPNRYNSRRARAAVMTLRGLSAALIAGCTGSAFAQADSKQGGQSEGVDDRQIVVIGDRTIIAALKATDVERTYDAAAVASYAFDNIGEMIEQVSRENGDSDPSLLVNGKRVSGVNDIGDYPVEAIERVEVLPPAAAARIGGTPGQRAYNVVLKRHFRNLTVTLGGQLATEGGWSSNRADTSFALIKGQDRINLSLRTTGNGMLLERDRDVLPVPEPVPYSALGNVIPASGAEIDPALSLLAGRPVSSVALAVFNARPSLGDLLAGANRTNPGNLSSFRSLRGSNRTYEASLAGSKQLTPWLTAALNGRLNWANSTSLSGLPAARFQLPIANTFTPFAVPVTIAVNDPTRPLRGLSDNQGQALTGTLNINSGDWRVTLVGRYDHRNRSYGYDQLAAAPGGSYRVDPQVNPFTGTLGSLIDVSRRTIRTTIRTRELSEDADGPLVRLPAGSVRLRLGIGAVWSSLNAVDSTGVSNSSYDRRDVTLRGGVTIPLTKSGGPGHWGIGDSELSIDLGQTSLSRFGKVTREAYVLGWQPVKGVRLSASRTREGRPVSAELAAAPSQEYQNVRFYDPLLNEQALVTAVYGGAANLRNETYRTDRISLSASPFPRNLAQFNLDYTATLVRDPIGALPPPSAAVVEAFPDRFQRDAGGHLIRVDGRTVNFDSQYTRDLRTALDLTVPLFGQAPRPPLKAKAAAPGPFSRPTLQLHAAHTWLLRSVTTIRAGLAQVDLLSGGAIGLGGGRPRHAFDGSVALASGGNGLRLSGRWTGKSTLRVGTVTVPDQLSFKSFATFDVRVFADLGSLLPRSAMLRGTRVTLSAENLTNQRQRVINSAGQVPTSFQSAYRDPIGRTVSMELRKVF